MAYDFKKLSQLAKKQEQQEAQLNNVPFAEAHVPKPLPVEPPVPNAEIHIPEEDFSESAEENADVNDTVAEVSNAASSGEQTDIIKYFSDTVQSINISKLHPYHNHTFSRLSDDEFEDLKLSIGLKGILEPLLVRGMGDGHYEIIAGHNRLLAAQALSIYVVPCRISNDNLTDDIADEIMVCTNLNRRNSFKISEMAKSIAVLVRARKRQGYRNDLYEVDIDDSQQKTRDKIGTEFGLSGAQIQRYIRLTFLTPSFLETIDEKTIPLVAGVNLSYLDADMQNRLMQYVSTNRFSYTAENTDALKRYAAEHDEITDDILFEIFSVDTEKRAKVKNITVKSTIISKYFTDKTAAEINDIIDAALANYFRKDGADEK